VGRQVRVCNFVGCKDVKSVKCSTDKQLAGISVFFICQRRLIKKLFNNANCKEVLI